MQNIKKSICLAVLFSGLAVADDAPTVNNATLTANVSGAILNAGAAVTGSNLNTKQAVSSLLHGEVKGNALTSTVVKGAIINAGAAVTGSKVDACQSVASIGSDCSKTVE